MDFFTEAAISGKKPQVFPLSRKFASAGLSVISQSSLLRGKASFRSKAQQTAANVGVDLENGAMPPFLQPKAARSNQKLPVAASGTNLACRLRFPVIAARKSKK